MGVKQQFKAGLRGEDQPLEPIASTFTRLCCVQYILATIDIVLYYQRGHEEVYIILAVLSVLLASNGLHAALKFHQMSSIMFESLSFTKIVYYMIYTFASWTELSFPEDLSQTVMPMVQIIFSWLQLSLGFFYMRQLWRVNMRVGGENIHDPMKNGSEKQIMSQQEAARLTAAAEADHSVNNGANERTPILNSMV